jgi:excisionase family DNA binding protein
MIKLVDIKELSEISGFPVRTLRSFIASKKIPAVRLGHRTLRFNLARVEKALNAFEVPAIGAKSK